MIDKMGEYDPELNYGELPSKMNEVGCPVKRDCHWGRDGYSDLVWMGGGLECC